MSWKLGEETLEDYDIVITDKGSFSKKENCICNNKGWYWYETPSGTNNKEGWHLYTCSDHYNKSYIERLSEHCKNANNGDEDYSQEELLDFKSIIKQKKNHEKYRLKELEKEEKRKMDEYKNYIQKENNRLKKMGIK